MKPRTIRKALPVVLAVTLLGIAAPTASATLLPASHDFGDQTVGTTSASYPFILSAYCSLEDPGNAGLCGGYTPVTPAVSTAGDFAQTNDCPETLMPLSLYVPGSCTINVTFTPAVAGSRTGTLTAGGVTSSVSGTGVAAAAPPTSQAPTFDLKAAIKKCKKKFPKRAKRKKCIKKAKAHAE